jgi:hypothetical protein
MGDVIVTLLLASSSESARSRNHEFQTAQTEGTRKSGGSPGVLGSIFHDLPIDSHNNKQAPPKRNTAKWIARFFRVVGAGFLAKPK